jgi:DNA-binding protein HU-beta
METGRSQKVQRLCLIASAVSDKPDAPKPKPPRGPIKVPRPTRGYSNVSTPSPLYATVRPPARKAAPKKQAAPGKQAVPPAKKAAPVGEKAAAPAKKAAAKAAPRVTITLKQIAAALAEGHDLPKKQAESLLDDLVALTTRHLKKGDKIRLTGLGTLQVQKRAARMGRNPATGEAIQIKAGKKIGFRPAKELKKAE